MRRAEPKSERHSTDYRQRRPAQETRRETFLEDDGSENYRKDGLQFLEQNDDAQLIEVDEKESIDESESPEESTEQGNEEKSQRAPAIEISQVSELPVENWSHHEKRKSVK
jgi:hypothetical protein